jgi:hypothetical protein
MAAKTRPATRAAVVPRRPKKSPNTQPVSPFHNTLVQRPAAPGMVRRAPVSSIMLSSVLSEIRAIIGLYHDGSPRRLSPSGMFTQRTAGSAWQSGTAISKKKYKTIKTGNYFFKFIPDK